MCKQNVASFDGRVGVIERILASYRSPLYDLLCSQCEGGVSVFAGNPRRQEGIKTTNSLKKAQHVSATNYYFFNGFAMIYWQRGILSWLENWNPDVLIVDANPRGLSTSLSAQWMRRRRRPVLGWGLGTTPSSDNCKFIRRKLRERFVRQFDGMIAYSSTAAEQYQALGVPRNRIAVAKNAVSRRPVASCPERKETFAGRPVILFVGRILPRKRLELLFEACARLPVDLQPILRIVGDGPALEAYKVKASQLYPSAEFLGALYGEELARAFRQADLFVLPGKGGLAIQEAMSYGLPVIVGEADGTEADLVTPKNGWVAIPGDIDNLSSLISEALSDCSRLRLMGQESYRIVSDEVNLEQMVGSFLRLLHTVA